MKVLLWHGYLLRGSGSNVYTANLARVLRALGHEVTLLCQETRLEGLDFVDAVVDRNELTRMDSSNTSVSNGSCTLVRPDIGTLLPVYVYDPGESYAGFTAKRFVDLSDQELDRYVSRNVEALRRSLDDTSFDACFVGHEIMGPYIARAASSASETDYVVQLHGSALEYAVKIQERYVSFAREGLGAARAVVGGSRYMVEAASAVVPGWRSKAAVVNPGCDIAVFRSRPRVRNRPTVGFVGKLIPAKGVQDFIVASAAFPSNTTVRVVGFGEGGPWFQRLVRALARADAAAAGEALEALGPHASAAKQHIRQHGIGEPSEALGNIEFLGRLDHDRLPDELATWDVLVVPSVVPEAFGMVAAEAAACGVLPVVPRHSGLAEIGRSVEDAVDAPGLLTYDPSEAVSGIFTRVRRILALPEVERRTLGEAVAAFARRVWSWEVVAEQLLQVATGSPDSHRFGT